MYEERLVVVRARSQNQAIRVAEREARAYAKGLTSVKYLGFVEVFELFARALRSGAEVFSLMRSSNLAPAGYLSRFFDDGSEHRRPSPSREQPNNRMKRTRPAQAFEPRRLS